MDGSVQKNHTMHNITLFEEGNHKFILLNEGEPGEEEGVRSNQFLIRHNEVGVLVDPGGFGVMPRVMVELMRHIEPQHIKAIILSHQDPDIVGGLSSWLEFIDAPVYISRIWLRFLPHYGIKQTQQFVGVPDSGMDLDITDDFHLQLLPAHFLHSEGQINLYDPVSKILFTGDIGAAIMPDESNVAFVDDFDRHLPCIEGFHRRYMCGNRAARLWVEQVRALDIKALAPQHGPIYIGDAVGDFLNWLKDLQCGMDLMESAGVFTTGK